MPGASRPRDQRPHGASQGSETTTTSGCSFRTQQGAYAPHQPHQELVPTTEVAVLEVSRPLPAPNLPVSPPSEHPDPTFAGRGLHATFRWMVLLRKEVIQPHLPVRLPCYDFVPIASPTFDSSLPQGVGPPASGVTDFRDVTGGVYKARERIHRSVSDLRLLATPTSRGRVADPDPN